MSAVQSRQFSQTIPNGDLTEQLSAFLDGEADAPEWLDTPHGKEHWETYHLIGDVLRTADLALPVSARFTAGLEAALRDEPTVLAPRPRPVARFMRRYAMPGVSLMVLVVAVSWLAQPLINPLGPAHTVQASAPAQDVYAANAPRREPEFADYYDVHRHVAGMSGATQVDYAPTRD